MSVDIDQAYFREAIDRIARTPDGAVLYRYLQKTLCGVLAGNVESCALAFHEGKRMLASELMGLMAQGVSTHDRTDAIVTFSLAGRSRDARRQPAGRRITRDTFVPGFDDPDTIAVPGEPPNLRS